MKPTDGILGGQYYCGSEQVEVEATVSRINSKSLIEK